MPKKIIDIKAPQPKAKNPIAEGGNKKSQKAKKRQKAVRISWLVWVALSVVVILVVVFLIITFSSSVVLSLTMKQTPKSFNQEIQVSTEQLLVDIENMVLPAKFFEKTAQGEETFQATGAGSEEGRAEGTIIVYNNQNPVQELSLRAQTRFLSAEDGKIFKAPAGVHLPAAKIVAGKVVPSKTEVSVVAQDAGEEYNIGASQFSVPGLSGTAWYYSIWAESSGPMQGGFTTAVKKITDQDIEKAEEELKSKLLDSARNKLKTEFVNDFVFEPSFFSEVEFESTCNEKPGEIIDEFKCQGAIKVVGFSFRTADALVAAQVVLEEALSLSEKARLDTIELAFSPRTILIEEGKMIVDLSGQAQIYIPLDQEVFVNDILGKNKAETEEIISSDYSQIKEIVYDFFPFWVSKVPKNSEKIELLLTF